MRSGKLTVAALMVFEAGTLAIASAVHLSGVTDGSKPFTASGAGVAEAVICVVLLGGAWALLRSRRGRDAALAATAFAILGFLVGLSFTLRGGEPGDLIYHACMLPVLVATAMLLARDPRLRTDPSS